VAHPAREIGIEITTEIEVGYPAEHIIHKAENDNVDLVVLGRRGTSSFHNR